jgi:hypothetical protein
LVKAQLNAFLSYATRHSYHLCNPCLWPHAARTDLSAIHLDRHVPRCRSPYHYCRRPLSVYELLNPDQATSISRSAQQTPLTLANGTIREYEPTLVIRTEIPNPPMPHRPSHNRHRSRRLLSHSWACSLSPTTSLMYSSTADKVCPGWFSCGHRKRPIRPHPEE